MATALSLLAAACFGSADFLGGSTSRREGVFGVVVGGRIAAVALLAVLAPLLSAAGPQPLELWWGGLAGIGGGVGVVLLYRGLVIGKMSVIAPVSALGSSALPVLVGLLLGERPSWLALCGVAAGVAAVVLVSAPRGAGALKAVRDELRPGGATLYGLGAGSCFAVVFVAMNQAGAGAGLWPVLAAQTSSLVCVAAAAGLARKPLAVSRQAVPRVLLLGLLSTSALTSFLLASRTGLLTLVAVVTSLYPVVTVSLARLVLREQLTALQRAGLVAALAGVVLIALG